jgi:hypothetical protein
MNQAPQSTDPNVIADTRAHVVYERETGKVLHVHHSVTFGRDPEEGSAEDRARRWAGASGAGAEVIEVDPAEVSGRRGFRVDPARRRIVRDNP